MGERDAAVLATGELFTDLGRRLLAEPTPRRWDGAITPLLDDQGSTWGAMASFVGAGAGDEGAGAGDDLFAALALAEVAGADRRLHRQAAALARGRRWVALPGAGEAPAGVEVVVAGAWARECPEYAAIADHYGARRTRRSQVLLLHHIDEGIAVLRAIDAPMVAIRAYCIHPLVQGDDDLRESWERGRLAGLDAAALALALEYRSVANAFLSPMEDHPGYDDPRAIRRSPLAEVDAMLIADKIQNSKDFILYHRDSHPRAAWLARYFDRWLSALAVTPARARELRARITAPRPRLGPPVLG